MELMTENLFKYLFLAALVLSGGSYSEPLYAQSEASARHYTDKEFILDGEHQPFYIELSNPTVQDFRVVRVTVSFSANVDVGGLDENCSQWKPNNATQIICVIPRLKAQSFQQLTYYIVGDASFRPGFQVGIDVSSLDGSISVQSQEQTSVGLSDDNRFVEGPILDIGVARDILRDSDSDGITDFSEHFQATDPFDSNSVSNQNAMIDVAILLSHDTDEYYQGLFGGRAEYLIAATNQHFRQNSIAITLRLAALGRVNYSGFSIADAFDDLFNGDSEAFADVDSIIEGVGADVVIFAHPMFRNFTDDFCVLSLSNALAIQGDFYREAYSRRMLSILDVSRDCLSIDSLVSQLAINMGVVTTREEEPDGGTFSFSSGHFRDGSFVTSVPGGLRSMSPLSAGTNKLQQLSSPSKLCLGQPCGIDRDNLSQGADAVFSLNATRHVIADLNPSRFANQTDEIDSKITIDADNASLLEVRQFSEVSSAGVDDWVLFNVEATNNSNTTLHNLEFRFLPIDAGELFRKEDHQCAILTVAESKLTQGISSSIEGRGDYVCYVNSLRPGQVAGFSYAVKIENPNPTTSPSTYFQAAAVNNVLMPESFVCVPIVTKPTDTISSAECDQIAAFITEIADSNSVSKIIDLSLLPTTQDSTLAVPFTRLHDGGLISALLEIVDEKQGLFTLVDVNFLDPDLSPASESEFTSQGMLTISNVSGGALGSTIKLQYIEGSEPAEFVRID